MSLSNTLQDNAVVQYFSSSILRKLLLMLALVALLPMAILGYTMYTAASGGIMSQAFDQLTAIRTVKANQIESYFEQIDNQIGTFSENQMVVDAMKQFPTALASVREETSVQESQLDEMKQSLLGYYSNQFGAEYTKITGNKPDLRAQMKPLDLDSIYLQYQYISNNPNPLGSKEDLDAAPDGTQYSTLHSKFHPIVRSYLRKFEYYDIFLCDLDSGDIVYSVYKEMDFTTSLRDGPYAKTNFGEAFRLAAAAENKDDTFLVDYETYTPSYEAPASFISSPIFDGEKKIGVAIFQMPIGKISGILDERAGLGTSGETYAVGPDNLMRNDSRFIQDDKNNGAGLISTGYITSDTTIINPELVVTTEPVLDVFTNGDSGTKIIDDYRGAPVLSSWTPVTVYKGAAGRDPIKWALMSEMDLAEVRSPIAATGMLRQSAVVVLLGTLIGAFLTYWFARRISSQADSINDMLSSIGIGIFDARAEKITNDELGDVAIALNAMCDNTLTLIQSNDERQEIQESIESLIGEMENIAAGDLTINAEVKEDITGSIAGTVNSMTEQLRSIVSRVQNATDQVTTSAGSIANVSNSLSQESDAQADQITNASQKVVDITTQIQAVANQSEDSAKVAQKARETASRGFQAVSDTVQGMDRIREQVQATSKRIKRLGESSQEIGEIVQLISDIADRTSILALNASIQAAMAGDAGQGFAVVAEEVERLAERSTDATKQISTLIKAIQTETSEAIADMEESTREVVEGSQLASQAGQTLSEIDDVSRQLEDLIKGVSTSALEQANAATDIATTMTKISETTKASADKSRNATQSVGQLSSLANQLRESVSQFKLTDGVNEEEASVLNEIEEVSAIATSATEKASADKVDSAS
jgi:methyl-accepting chemotaxis protein